MNSTIMKWGGLALMAGALLTGVGNFMSLLEVALEPHYWNNGAIWGHGLLATGIAALTWRIMNPNLAGVLLAGLALLLLGTVLLGSGLGMMLLHHLGELDKPVEQLADEHGYILANAMAAHFGYVFGMLLIFYAVLSSELLARPAIYAMLLVHALIALGLFFGELYFAICMLLLAIAGVWVGALMMAKANSEKEHM